jgi:hypothetical protein
MASGAKKILDKRKQELHDAALDPKQRKLIITGLAIEVTPVNDTFSVTAIEVTPANDTFSVTSEEAVAVGLDWPL